MALDVPYRSIPDMFLQAGGRDPRPARVRPPGAGRLRAGLADLGAGRPSGPTRSPPACTGSGVGLEDPVAILANTRLDWIIADLGIMCAGGATTTVYPTTEPRGRDVHHRRLRFEGAVRREPGPGGEDRRRATCPRSPTWCSSTATADPTAAVPQLTLAELEERGAAALRRRARPDRPAGRRGRPGPPGHADLHLRHHRPAEGRRAAARRLVLGGRGAGRGRAAARRRPAVPVAAAVALVRQDAALRRRSHVGLPTYVDGRVDKLVEMLAVIRPTLMCGAPRVFEKVYNKAVTTAQDAGGAKAKIFAWARRGRQGEGRPGAGRPAGAGAALKLQVRAGREAGVQQAPGPPRRPDAGAGLRRGAAERGDRRAFFAAANLPISEGYGLTETSAGNFVNPPDGLRIGTVGRAMGDLGVPDRHRRRDPGARARR